MLDATTKQRQVLSAALRTFGRYGYRRTSMELIAQAAQVSRPALYQHFRNKQDVFRAMTAQMVDGLIDAAELARRSEGTVADRLEGVLSVKIEFVAGTVDAEFRSEILADAEKIAGDLVQSFKDRLHAVVSALLTESSVELDLVGAEFRADDVAHLLLDAVVGIVQEDAAPDVLDKRLRDLVHLTIRGLTSR
ncbi:TetR/AcrR family transcriptional regulator [Streptomyces triticirhizae]|uniref:TetR/AcrR family transcriptional regulator n=1 Tax=Streptomyces triticirhizae TaxID=2483353 RepID=UPI0013154D6F|nr:TetR/AcrR family transcriptional regulator [Streptomyces triticirhizae]